MALLDDEIDRYARHIMLKEIGGPGQSALKNSRVLVVGAGGLGSPILLYLAAAGVGTIGIVDNDHVSLSNLQRQILFRTHDQGQSKAEHARQELLALNPHTSVTAYTVRLDEGNATQMLTDYDLVLDGSDNFHTRYLLSDACFMAHKPLITGWLGTMDGGLTTLKPYEKSADHVPHPTYRCLFPESPPEDEALPCEATGVLGPLAGIIGTMMALEAIREITGFGRGLTGILLRVCALTLETRRIAYSHDPENPLNGRNITLIAKAHNVL
jgi:molybdopterin/thiamine biosynthesis adenylyltransferase